MSVLLFHITLLLVMSFPQLQFLYPILKSVKGFVWYQVPYRGLCLGKGVDMSRRLVYGGAGIPEGGDGVYQRVGSRYTGGGGGRVQVYHRVGVGIPEGARTRKTCDNKMHYIYVKIRHF